MQDRRKALRKALERSRGGQKRWRCPEELRSEVVSYAQSRRASGTGVRLIAVELARIAHTIAKSACQFGFAVRNIQKASWQTKLWISEALERLAEHLTSYLRICADWRYTSIDAAEHKADVSRRKCREEESNTPHSSHGRSGLPAARGSGRLWRQDRG